MCSELWRKVYCKQFDTGKMKKNHAEYEIMNSRLRLKETTSSSNMHN